MVSRSVILNERESREARATVAELERALSSEKAFEPIVAGFPPQVVVGFRKALAAEKSELVAMLSAYEKAKTGNYAELKQRAGDDPGLVLIVARIAEGLTQKDLAWKLGLKEQQVQRYEADRYRSISLSNYQKIAMILGVYWEMKLSDWTKGECRLVKGFSALEMKKILKHARTHGWFDRDQSAVSEVDEGLVYLQGKFADHMVRFGSPSLLRTGLNVEDHTDDLALIAWKSRIIQRAEEIIEKESIKYQAIDFSWLIDLVSLSVLDDGPAQARELLIKSGIVLIVEPQIPGMKVDGAAFLVNDIPVVGMTLRRDTLDNFWFTLLHEIAHVVLHYRTGLSIGFFDDIEHTAVDEMEDEANEFASNMLVPDEKWNKSPARIATKPEIIEKFAREQKIHPAILFGRIQKERNNYAIFSGKIGRGLVRKALFS